VIYTVEIDSRVLGRRHRSLVLVPATVAGGTRPVPPSLPVLYLFRGRPDEWFDRTPERAGRNVETVLHHLLELGYMPPLVMVFPDSMARVVRGGEVQGCAFDLVDGGEALGRFWLDEYFPALEREVYGANQEPRARAVGGFSLGSLTAFSLAARAPSRFRAVTSYDGAFLFWNNDHPAGTGTPENDLRLDLFPDWFGLDPSYEVYCRAAPEPLFASAAGRNLDELRRLVFFQHASAEDHPTANAWREWRMRDMVHACGCRQGFDEGLLDEAARHDWYWVDEHLYRLLPRLAAVLTSPVTSEPSR